MSDQNTTKAITLVVFHCFDDEVVGWFFANIIPHEGAKVIKLTKETATTGTHHRWVSEWENTK